MGKLKSRRGRGLATLALVVALAGLWFVVRTATEQQSWASTQGVVQERLRSGKSFSVRVAYTLPDGRRQEATLSENGPARHPGEQVTVRYDLENGEVADAALADNDEAFWVWGILLGLMTLGSLGVNLAAWTPAPRD